MDERSQALSQLLVTDGSLEDVLAGVAELERRDIARRIVDRTEP